MRRSITPVAALILSLAAPLAAASTLVLAPTFAAVSLAPKGDKGNGKPEKQDKNDKSEKGDKGEKGEKGEKGKGHDAEDGDDDSDGKGKGREKKEENTPHLGRALKELRLARNHLDNAKHDFGGHKASALKAIDDAIAQIQLAMKYDPESTGGTPAPNPDGTPAGTPGGAPSGEPSSDKPGKGKGGDAEHGKGKKKDK